MKEIIYLDTKLVNSLLAQTNKGLVNKLVSENSESNSNAESGTETKSTTGSGGVSFGIKANASHTEIETGSYNAVFSKSNRNLIETALDDYSLDVLIDSLEKNIKNNDYKIGDFILIDGTLQSYNFKTLIHSVELKGIGSQLEGYDDFIENRKKFDKLSENSKHLDKNKQLSDKVKNSPWNNFYNARLMADYMDSLFPNMTLIKVTDTLSVCDNDMIRMNPAILNFNNIGKRTAKVFGIVTSQFDEQVPQEFTEVHASDVLYRNTPSILSNIILGSNNIIKKDEFILRPIAIYFE